MLFNVLQTFKPWEQVMENYLTISQAAQKIGVSSETLRRWDKAGKFPSQRHPINNYRVYNEEQIEFVINELQQLYITDYANSLQYQITPFFETRHGKLFNEDVVTFFKSIETSSVQLIFADPPYNPSLGRCSRRSNSGARPRSENPTSNPSTNPPMCAQ